MEISAEDVAWLSKRIGVFDPGAKAPSDSFNVQDPQAGIVVEPTGVASAAAPVIALVGWPTGRHHSLIKAAEARMAVQEGATEIWLAVDLDLLATDTSAVLADIIAVSQVVDEPARLGVVCTGDVDKQKIEALARIAERADVAVLAVAAGVGLPDTTSELVVYGVSTLEGAVDALYAGAKRVFATPAAR